VFRASRALFIFVVAVSVGAVLTPALPANAASSGAVSITTSSAVTQASPATFNFDISWSCSGVAGDTCNNTRIVIPISLDNLTGGIEDIDSWAANITLPVSSVAGFTTVITPTPTQLLLTLTSTSSIPAGTQESILLAVRPHPSVGDGVGFRVGPVTMQGNNFTAVSSNNTLAASVTVRDLPAVDAVFLGASVTPPGTDLVANYEIYPNIAGVWNPTTNAWSSWSSQDNNRNSTDTAVEGSITIVNQLPVGTTFVSATGGGVHDPALNTVTWTNVSNVALLPFRVRASYPPNPPFRPTLTSTVTRTFTDTAGVVQSSTDSVTHSTTATVRLDPFVEKCGQGRVAPQGDVSPGGQCNPWWFSPTYAFSGDVARHTYTLSAARLLFGDVVTVSDWMPCFTNPVATPGPVTEGFASLAGCTNTTSTITELRLTAALGSASSSPIDYQSIRLYLSDGNFEDYDDTRRLPSFSPLPIFSSGAKVVGFEATLVPLIAPGTVQAVMVTRLTPGADRNMNLHNIGTVAVLNNGYFASRDAEGIGAVRRVVAATAIAGMAETFAGGVRTTSSSFGVWGLNPSAGMPTYTQVLPAGYRVVNNQLSSITMSGSSLSHYDVELIAEDLTTGRPAMVRVTPRAGTPAVPATADDAWPFVGVTLRIEATWGPPFGALTTESFTSLSGAVTQIDRCLQAFSPLVVNDPRDLDGDGLTGGDRGCLSLGGRIFLPVQSAATSTVSKLARDVTSSTWSGAGQTAVLASGAAEYRIRWQNNGTPTLSNIVLYDVFPHVGDTGTIVGQTGLRGSGFTPIFDGLTSAIPARVTVDYTASTNPCRPEVYPGLTPCVNDWTPNLALIGTANARGMRISLDGNWTAGQSADVTFRMLAPSGTPSGVPAWNTVASRASTVGGAMVPSETARTGIAMPADVRVAKTSAQSAAPVGIGDAIEYEITATNLLNSAANGVRIVDELTSMLQYAGAPSSITATIAGVAAGSARFDSATRQLVWDGNLGVGQTVTIRFTMQATSATPNAGGANSVVGTIGSLATNCVTGAEAGCTVSVVIVRPSVTIDKFAAATVEGSLIEPNTTVNWTYRVTNNGTEALDGLVVTDSRGVVVTCPATTLARAASMDCVGSGSAGSASPYENTGIVSGSGVLSGDSTTASDSWSVRIVPRAPAVSIVKDSANVTEGGTVAAESVITWRYTVTNTGTDTLRAVSVVDNQNVAVTCPATTLAPGASIVCTGSDSVGFGPGYTNIATVNAVGGFTATIVSAVDDWSVNVTPYSTGITIDKFAPAVVEASEVLPNTPVAWQYLVTNAGGEAIRSIVVVDDQGVAVTCPSATLAVGASMTCTGSGSVGAGPTYQNMGSVSGETVLTGTPVVAEDLWSIEVRNPVPTIAAVKGALNAVEGALTPALFTVDWQYTVVNTGEETLNGVVVTDDRGVVVSCPSTTLAVGASMTCTGSGSVGTGTSYTNLMRVTAAGAVSGVAVEASDPWTVPIDLPGASVRVLKDAIDIAAGDVVTRALMVTWSYEVVNMGGQPLRNVLVTDDQGVTVTCPATTLGIGESMVCTGIGSVGTGVRYTNIATALATPAWQGVPIEVADAWTTPLSGPVPSTPAGTPGLPGTGVDALIPLTLAGLLLAAGVFLASHRRWGTRAFGRRKLG